MSISDVVVDINAMLNTAVPPSIVKRRCIYKVPYVIRKLNEDAYTPTFVSIGPFHHRHPHPKPQHQNMEREKLIHFKSFLERSKECLNNLVSYVESILSDFKSCYSETLQISPNDLVKLILIDSGFIIELFRRDYFGDKFISNPWLESAIQLDLLLLENQLPFFVIEKIYILSCSSYPSFHELTVYYFQNFNKSGLSFYNADISIRHFTDLLRIFHLQYPIESRPSRQPVGPGMIHLPSVTELLEAGVRFKVSSESDLLEWRFSRGHLEIPQLLVGHHVTETIFRNIIVLEQFHYPDNSYILDYVTIMDFLINTGKDADILVQNKILENWFGDHHSVANMFNGLCKNIIHSSFSSHFLNLCEDLNTFYGDPSNKLKSSLMRDYCNTPWHTAASVAGIVLLVLTLLQSACSVLQVEQQPNASK